VVVAAAVYVPLLLKLHLCVQSDYLRGHVKAAILEVLSNHTLANGKRGFFHPDNLTFGQGVYLSQIVATVQAVEGVEAIWVERFERQFEGDRGEKTTGVISLAPMEVARLDNNPNMPENGILELKLEGGR
jgi:hypothetical protein